MTVPRSLVQHQYNSVGLGMKGWLRWSCCFHAASQRGSFGASAGLRLLSKGCTLNVQDRCLWAKLGELCKWLYQKTSCVDRVMLEVQKAWIKPAGESEQVCVCQELGWESCWCEERWGCGEWWGWDRFHFPCWRYPVVTVMWQSERNRAGGQVLVCLFKLGWGKHKEKRLRAGLWWDGAHQGGRWARKNFWEAKEMTWACLSSYAYFMAISSCRCLASSSWEGRNEICCWGLLSGNKKGTFDNWEQQFW